MSVNARIHADSNERSSAIAAHRVAEDTLGPMRNRLNASSARQLVAPYATVCHVRPQCITNDQPHQASLHTSVCCSTCVVAL